eukprot:173192-Hanusia_phi.AAC.2
MSRSSGGVASARRRAGRGSETHRTWRSSRPASSAPPATLCGMRSGGTRTTSAARATARDAMSSSHPSPLLLLAPRPPAPPPCSGCDERRQRAWTRSSDPWHRGSATGVRSGPRR